MLDDMLVEGTGIPLEGMPPEEKMRAGAGPRVYLVNVKQGSEDVPTKPAYCVIGQPVGNEFLQIVRDEFKLSTNYGAVIVPDYVLDGVYLNDSSGVVGNLGRNDIVRGLMPTMALRFEASSRGYLSNDGKEAMIFVSPEDLHGLKLR
jgi:hypothetical protein